MENISFNLLSVRLNMSLNNLNGLSSCSSGQEEMEDSGLSHDVDRARGQLILARVDLLVVVPAVQHGRAEHRGQVVERHFVLVLKLTHPHHVLDQEDDASLVRVLIDLREEAEKG